MTMEPTPPTPVTVTDFQACKSCRAPIRFARSEHGAVMPFDAQPVLVDGTYDIAADGIAYFVPKDLRAGKGQLYMPHWATCPSAGQHRRRK